MAYRINISREAEKDIQTAKYFYRISGLEKEFDTDFVNQIAYLKTNPYLFQIYYRSIRRLHFHDFSYSIHYLIRGKDVFILRVLHGRQDYK